MDTRNSVFIATSLDGFIAAVNPDEAGVLRASGFDVAGTGPGTDLHLLTVNWVAVTTGTSILDLDVKTLTDSGTTPIGTPNGIDGTVTVH